MIRWRKFLEELALGAGELTMRYFGKVHEIEHKKNAGIVTEADHNAEIYLVKKILKKYPQSSIITEESGELTREKQLVWVIDPLDGTSNYAHGYPWFCVSIGLYEDGKPEAGVVYHPPLKDMFYAEKGAGTLLNGKHVRVSRTTRFEDSLLSTGFYYCKGEKLRSEMNIFRVLNEVALGVRRPGSAALDLAYVACGRFDAFWERGLAPWDVAAGLLLVMEAGGVTSDYRGQKTTLFSKEVIASNGLMHSKMVKMIRMADKG